LNHVKLLFDFSYTIGNILLLVLLLMFFIKFSKGDEVLNYRSSRMFWVCLGIMIFYIGSMPFYGMRSTIYNLNQPLFYFYWHAQFGLNYLMYILFIISFIWGREK
jgi:hypothetical protein